MSVYPTRERANRRRGAGNPLLMVVGNNPREDFWAGTRAGRSAARDVSRPAPFREGRKVPIKQFEKWLFGNATQAQIRDYKKALKEYKRFHLGAEPRTITREVVTLSSNKGVHERAFSYSMGKSTHETYNAPKHSKKSGTVYVHKYDDQPEAAVFPGGRVIMKKLKRGARITDWMRG